MREEFRLIQTAKVLEQVLYSRTSVLQNVSGTVNEVSVWVVFHRWRTRTLHVFNSPCDHHHHHRHQRASVIISDQRESTYQSASSLDGIGATGAVVVPTSSHSSGTGRLSITIAEWLVAPPISRQRKQGKWIAKSTTYLFSGTKKYFFCTRT